MINDRYTSKPVQSEVDRAKSWILQQKTVKTINYKTSTYHYKHVAERCCGGYISQDSFNEALDQLGIKRSGDYTCFSKRKPKNTKQN